ncbi:hypothetical protein Tco_1549068 [Tanacetum coccineum]
MSFDDLYNNFKIVEQEVKRTVTSSSNLRSQNMAFVSTPGSTNEVDTANIQVSTSSTPISTASHKDNLELIHKDDLEEMDLKWQLALLSMRARRNNGAPLIMDWESDGEDEVKSPPEIERKTINPSVDKGHSHKQLEDQGYFNSGCSKHMTGIYPTLQTFKSLIEDMLHLGEELKVMCDKNNSVLFTDTDCFVLSPDFKLADENHVLLKVPRNKNVYSVDMKNIVHKKDLTCLVSKAINEESMLWYRKILLEVCL